MEAEVDKAADEAENEQTIDQGPEEAEENVQDLPTNARSHLVGDHRVADRG